uniref:Uncharacterized protein n=1 Tax=Ditylenchus dipsaci TaxID=166011 RepID=A0A915DNT3_9BILA
MSFLDLKRATLAGWVSRTALNRLQRKQGEAADMDGKRSGAGRYNVLSIVMNLTFMSQVAVLHKEISRFSADDVFNADET